MNAIHRAGLLATLAVVVCGLTSGACLQVAGLNGFEEGGASTDVSVSNDGGGAGDSAVVPTGDAMTDAAKRPQCSAADTTCPSGTTCDTAAQGCVEASGCANLEGETCATYRQCDCDPGFTCTPNRGSRGNECVAAAHTARGGACDISSSTPTCQLGLGCFDDLCMAFCDPDNLGSSGCAPTETCTKVTHDPDFAVCVPSCNPLADHCSSNCDFLSDLNEVPICVSAGTAFSGDTCDPSSASASVHCAHPLVCGPGSVCVTPVASQADCPSGTAFRDIYGLAFGYCE